MSHLIERRKELKRRRKRRWERLKARNKKITVLKPKPVLHPTIPRDTETITTILQPVATIPAQLIHPHETNTEEPIRRPSVPTRNIYQAGRIQVASVTELIKTLPEGVKSKKIWQDVPEQLKEEIIARARQLLSERNFTPPAGWDGSLKQALLEMYRHGRIPRGFGVYLGLA